MTSLFSLIGVSNADAHLERESHQCSGVVQVMHRYDLLELRRHIGLRHASPEDRRALLEGLHDLPKQVVELGQADRDLAKAILAKVAEKGRNWGYCRMGSVAPRPSSSGDQKGVVTTNDV